jgi:hypothetical protein
MRRILAVSALSLGLAVSFVPSASAAPDCDIAQNCVCTTVNGVTTKVTGYSYLHCA